MEDQRLDKWLWCARFYKTRGLAHDAIQAGHVVVNGQRPKPAKVLTIGTALVIKRAPFEYHLEVLGMAKQRLSAPLAQALYRETEGSLHARVLLAEQLKLSAVHEDSIPGKLDKRARRVSSTLKRTAGDFEDIVWHD
jgi:ribosome-associated heat shock protein Hsp15